MPTGSYNHQTYFNGDEELERVGCCPCTTEFPSKKLHPFKKLPPIPLLTLRARNELRQCLEGAITHRGPSVGKRPTTPILGTCQYTLVQVQYKGR